MSAVLGAIDKRLAALSSSGVGLAAVLAGAAVVLCACGATRDPLREVVGASKKTLAFPRVSFTVALDGTRLFAPAADVPGGRAAYDFTTGVGYEALAVQRQNGEKRTLYVDFVPASVYLAPWPTPAGLLPPGKIWVTVAFAGPGAAANRQLAAQLEGLGPELALEEIAWGARSASHLGTRTIRHVPMEEYTVSVDLAKALAAARRAGRIAVAAAIEAELRAPRSRRPSFAVWVTGAGHVGRIDVTRPGSGLGTVSFAFTSFHAQFSHNRPRPSQSVALASITEPRFLWTIATRS
jgi:hypothetical protein